jgi:hypothetical protein
MTTLLNLADLLFLQAAVNAGPFHAPGTDPFTLAGTRTTDGTFNNLTNTTIVDQYGNTVDTDLFANKDQPFFHVAPGYDPLENPEGFATGFEADGVTPYIEGLSPGNPWYQGVEYAPTANVIDNAPRLISNLVASMETNPIADLFNPAAETSEIFGNNGSDALFIQPTNALFTFFGQFFDHGLDFVNKGPAGDFGTVAGDFLGPTTRATLDANGDPINSTAPLVDQSQTYASSPDVTFYLMEYDANGIATGRLVTHADGTMATWADIKANALKKGIVLDDTDGFDIPAPVFNGLPNNYTKGAGTGQNLLADINFFADPAGGTKDPDNNGTIGLGADSFLDFYDNELLDAHKVAGDGRVNENVALTAIHQAFHGEHNRIVLQIQDLIEQQDQLTPGFVNQWDGARIFEAAKLVNEMQYQHFVFEEYARRLSPNVDEFAQYDVTINPNVSLEFSQAIFRLGHSQLTDDVLSVNAADQEISINAPGMPSLVAAFLNPVAFDAVGAADLIEGQTRQEMNEIDNHVVDSVRNLLLGQPLDLAAINIARGRDVNLPTLNQLRQEIFDQTGGQAANLAPYVSWSDFGAHLLHPDSLVNFIAAYTRDDGIVGSHANDIAIARSNALANEGDPTFLAALRLEAGEAMLDPTFMGEAGNQGFEDIDLWIGGLAEAHVTGAGASAGMLGSTFDFIFAQQLIALQNGDRLYYLGRLAGTNLLDTMEGTKFGELFERGTGARHTNGDIFGAADEHVEMSSLELGGTQTFTTQHALADLVSEVVGGTTLDDTISTGSGNDTVWAEDGDDEIDTGNGADFVYGGAGDDIINAGDNNDFVRGDAGDDLINAGLGDDVIFSDVGNDTVNAGDGFNEVFAGKGNDTINGGAQDDTLVGNENDDIISGGGGNDALEGSSGNDYLSGGIGVDTLLGLEENDILVGGAGADTLDGGLLLPGYDMATYATPAGPTQAGLVIDMTGAVSTGDALGDIFIDIEEVRGTAKNDQILGDALGNVLSGGGGQDLMNGGDGDDTLYSNDLFADTLIGGLGIDLGVWLGYNFGDAVFNVDTDGVGTVQVGGFTDTLSGVEFLGFDDGIWSASTLEFVPLIGVTDSATQTINGIELDGNLVSNFALLDNTVIPVGGIHVGDVEILDPDGVNGTRVVNILGPDAASFIIQNGPGGVQELRFIGGNVPGQAMVNFEAKEFYNISLDVADGSGGSAINYTLNVTDVNDNAPLMTSPDRVNVFEGADTNIVIYRSTATDRDLENNSPALTPLEFTLAAPGVGNDNGLFSPSDNGEVRFTDPAVAGTYNLEVESFDGVHTTTKIVQVVVSPTPNAPPEVVFVSKVLAADTGASGSDFITQNGNITLSGTYDDPDSSVDLVEIFSGQTKLGDATLTPGLGNSGTWSFVTNLGVGTHNLRAVATDDGGLNGPVGKAVDSGGTVIVDQTATAVMTFNPITADNIINFAESGANIAITGTVNGEVEQGDVVSLTINGIVYNGAVGPVALNTGAFSIIVPASSLVDDANKTVDGSVSISDVAGNVALIQKAHAYLVNLAPPNGAPVITSDGGGSAALINVAENTSAVTTVTATDADLDPLSILIVGGADQAKFQIVNGVVSFISAPDFEKPTDAGGDNVYEVQVQVSDGNTTDLQTLSVNVTDVAGNTVNGTSAKDTINGSNGATAEADVISGKGKSDKLFGLAGDDELKGNKGKDRLDGGADDDELDGGKGGDTYVFADGYGNDSAKYQAGQDKFDLSGTGIDTFKQLKQLMDQQGNSVVIDFGGGDMLTVRNATIATLKANKGDFNFAPNAKSNSNKAGGGDSVDMVGMVKSLISDFDFA